MLSIQNLLPVILLSFAIGMHSGGWLVSYWRNKEEKNAVTKPD